MQMKLYTLFSCQPVTETALYLPLPQTTYKALLLFDIQPPSKRILTFEKFDQSDEET